MYQRNYHIHFVGIGGIGMSGIADMLLNLGYRVSGSDLKLSNITSRLKAKGATIFEGHAKDHITDPNVIVISSAVAKENPEVIQGKAKSIPIIPRAQMLAELMRIKYAIAISGAHGKTSTSSMIYQILNTAGKNPTAIIGGLLKEFNTNSFHGSGNFIVAEADESDGSLLKYSPSIAVVTNIDLEHLDFYRNLDHIKDTFVRFINSVPFYGLAVLCQDNEHIRSILPQIKVRYTTFGLTSSSDLQARLISSENECNLFQVFNQEQFLGDIVLKVPGRHYIYNALASIAVAMELNIEFSIIKKAFQQMNKVKRRLEIKGEKKNILIMDDYGHHPTEIIATLDTIREYYSERRIIVAFQPHRYTRTRALFDQFTSCFDQSDILIILPIYNAGEDPIAEVNSEKLCQSINRHGHHNVFFSSNFNSALTIITDKAQAGDLILTLGAGDIDNLGEKLMEVL